MAKKSPYLKKFKLHDVSRLCLAEVWIPLPYGKDGDALAQLLGHPDNHSGETNAPADRPAPPRYQRVVIAELSWKSVFASLHTFQCFGQKARLAAVTRYECHGRRLPEMIEVINLGLTLPRLYVANTITSRGAMEVALHMNKMPGKIKEDKSDALMTSQRAAQRIISSLLDQGFHNGDLTEGKLPIARHSFDFDAMKPLWLAGKAAYGGLRAGAWISAQRSTGRPVMFQPIPCDSMVVSRQQWIAQGKAAHEAALELREVKKTPLPQDDDAYHRLVQERATLQERASCATDAEIAFHDLPVITEAELGARAYGREMNPGFRLDEDTLILLAAKPRDPVAPPANLKTGLLFDRYAPVKDQVLFIVANDETHGGYCSFSPTRLVAEEKLGEALPLDLSRPHQDDWQFSPALESQRAAGITQPRRNVAGKKQRVIRSRKALAKKTDTVALPQRMLPLEPLLVEPQHNPFTTAIPTVQTDLFPVRPIDDRFKPSITQDIRQPV